MAEAFSNQGTKFQIKAETGETYTDIAFCRNISAPEQEQEDIEVTHNGTVGFRSYIPSGLTDPGELELQINSVPGDESQQLLAEIRDSGAIRTFRIVRPNGITETFSGYVKNITANEYDAQSPDAIIDTVALKLTGASTRTYEAPTATE